MHSYSVFTGSNNQTVNLTTLLLPFVTFARRVLSTRFAKATNRICGNFYKKKNMLVLEVKGGFYGSAINRNLNISAAVTATAPQEIEAKTDDLNFKNALRNTRRARRA